jgi:hypothetical protein
MAILKKFIGNDQVGATKIRLESDLALRARNAAGSADVDLLKLDSADILKLLKLPRLDAALAAPSNAKDIVPKEYVDTEVSSVAGDLTTLENRVDAIEDDYGAANGLATLDANGKVPVSQLPNSIMQYQGTWDASNNTPALANGAGNADTAIGDVYRVTVAGTVDFGAGDIAFAVGDYAILNSSKIWEKSDSTDIENAADLIYTQADVNDWTVAQGSSVGDTLDEVGSRLSALEVGGGDTKQVKISPDDSTEGYLESKVVGASGKISVSVLNDGGDEDLQISIGADVFDKTVDDTDDITEGASNKFYASTLFDADFALKSTSDLVEGTNLYYTQTRFDNAFALKSTSDLAEGTNLYYTQTRFDDAFDAKSAADLGYVNTTSGLLATDVQAAIDELDAELDGLSFAASAISFTPAGNIAAVTVQAAIEELDDEKLALAGGTMTGDIDMGSNDLVDSKSISFKDGSAYGSIVISGSDMAVSAVAALKLDAGTGSQIEVLKELDMNSLKIVGLATPTATSDAATKGYVDGLSVQQLVHESKTLSSAGGDLTSITVANTIVGQPWIQVGRVSLVPGDDFTVSGATITWAGSVATGQPEALEDGDKVSIYYHKSATLA